MRLSKRDECNLSPDDQVTVTKWRRVVFVFYGCAVFAVLAAWAASRIVNVEMTGATSTANLSVRPSSDSP
jgi:hypothetical protein